ncbi:hypothetical protein GCM10011519_05670 [Marmoricola endophyticus]|uniref:Uncharacterized protein n=1 Tax=Marmoricola endophyticus TaxID=2040280 RepID=A0A917BCI3_9ACTN|nr:hypothetical protein GCM10011519_05670 [Marmoricola endophyticus]
MAEQKKARRMPPGTVWVTPLNGAREPMRVRDGRQVWLVGRTVFARVPQVGQMANLGGALGRFTRVTMDGLGGMVCEVESPTVDWPELVARGYGIVFSQGSQRPTPVVGEPE